MPRFATSSRVWKWPSLVLSLTGFLLMGVQGYAMEGDINADGIVNVSDVQCVVLAVLDLSPNDPATTPSCLPENDSADLDCSNQVSVVDVQLSVQIVLGAMVGNMGLPASHDPDEDMIITGCDTCPDTYDPDQLDSDNDALGDACDPTPVECGGAPQVTCAGALHPDWSLENLHPDTAGYESFYGLDSYAGGVVVVMLLAST